MRSEVPFDVGAPDVNEWAEERPSALRHSAQSGQSASSKEVQNRSLDDVVGSVAEADHVAARIDASTLQEFVADGASGGLH